MISRANISKELTPNLGNAKRRNKMAKMDRVGLYPAEEKRSGTASQAARKRNMKKGGAASSKSRKTGQSQKKVKKYKAGGQGYSAREDESLGMEKGAAKSRRAMKVRRDESDGTWGRRKIDYSNHQKG